MKIRTDFVTNSSSSSYTVISVNTCDGRKYEIDMGEMLWSEDGMCHIEDGKLKYTYWDIYGEEKERTIKTVQQLMAIIYFNNTYEPAPYEIINPVFAFLIGKSSPLKLLEVLEDVEGFEDLQDIDPDDFDDRTELREAVLESLVACLEEVDIYVDMEDEQQIVSFEDIVRNIDDLKDIANVTVHTSETNWGEFTNPYRERLNVYVTEENHPFASVPIDSPDYAEAFTRWMNVMESEVLMGDSALAGYDLQDCVRAALASGNVWDLVPDTIQSHKDIQYLIAED